MEAHSIIGLLVAIAAFLFSAIKYQQINNNFDKNRSEIKSDRVFSMVYRYLQFSTLLFVILSFTLKPGWLIIMHEMTSLIYMGLTIVVLSLLIFQSATSSLGESYSPCFDLRKPKYFINTGIYKHIRHPIYTSNLTLLLGATIATGSFLVLCNFLLLLFFYYRSAKKEEADLLDRFNEYEAYKNQTGMFMFKIPGSSIRSR